MFTSLVLAATVWPLAVTEACAPEARDLMIGVARNIEGQFLYCEQVQQTDSTSLQVRYTQNRKLFAEKQLDFAYNAFSPSVLQQDFRSGELRKAEVSAQTVRLSYQLSSQKKLSVNDIPTQQVDIVDAGFDNFIRANWNDLIAQKNLAVNFASIAHLKTLPLRVSAAPLASCIKGTPQKNAAFCFLVEVDNALLRLLLGNIKLVYDQQQRLIQFDGVVNIADQQTRSQVAKIQYYYQQDYVQPQ